MPPVATLTDDSAPSSASADGKRPLGRRHSSSMTSRRYVCEGSRLLRPVLGQLRGPGSRQILVSVAVASIDEEVGARAGARRVGGAGRSREAAESPCAGRPRTGSCSAASPSRTGFGRMQYNWLFPTTGVSAKRPAACFADAPAPEATALASPIPRRPVVDPGPRHVIAEYRHRLQMVTCECGWQGSSASPDTRPSEWSSHVAAHRTGSR
jgi:hypothetical protein